jgi:hypothetical protein
MTDQLTPDQDALEPVRTVALTEQGWEAVATIEPEDDWRLLADGSYESPDGRLRTWMTEPPAGEDVAPLIGER